MMFYPLISSWLLLLFAIGGFLIILSMAFQKHPVLNAAQQKKLMILRLIAWSCFLLLLLNPGKITEDPNYDQTRVAFVIDHSASMGSEDLAQGQTRLEGIQNFIKTEKFPRLGPYHKHYFSFAETTKEIDIDDVGQLSPKGPTLLDEAIAQIDKEIGVSQLGGIVILSDGLDQTNFKGAAKSVPIFGVSAGTALKKSLDVAIQKPSMPEKVQVNESLSMEVAVHIAGSPKVQDLKLQLKQDGILKESKAIQISTGEPSLSNFQMKFDREGIYLIELSVSQLKGEATYLNNQRKLLIEVVDVKNQVLIYYPNLTNSFRHFMRQMRKDQQVQVVGMVQTSPGRYLLQGKKELAGNLQQGLPDSAEGIQNFSAIILGNQNKPALNEQDALILKQYVENGGSLILLGGKDSFVKDRIPNALEGMLPFSTLQQSYQTGKFIFTTAGLQASGFQRQMDQLIETNNGNIGLTAINRFQGLRPNAQIALYAQGEEKLPIVVWQDWGQGKVLTILTNQTQNLGSTAVRNQNFMTFMKQALTLSQNRNDLHDTLSFALSKNFVSPQETTKIIALVKGEVQETTEVIGDVFKHGSDQPIQSVELQALSELQYEGEIQALPPGDYVLRVQVLKEGQSIRKRYKMLTVGQVQQELADLAVNERNWDAICPPHRRFQLSEGTALESALLQAIRKKMVRKEIFPFWETPWLLIILILTLLTEWYLRRRYNLF